MTKYDSPWKEALYQHLRWLLMLLFPKSHDKIDWREDYHPLEQELRQIAPDAAVGTRYADALIRVRLLSGDERVLHAEVQAQPMDEQEFARRVRTYNYRSREQTALPVESLVILADDDPKWRPTRCAEEHDYSDDVFTFRPAKLLDWADKKEQLRTMDNPMGLFLLTHLEAQRTHGDDQERAKAKLDLLLRLAARKLDEEERRHWNRYVGWFLDLPKELDTQVYAQVRELTKEKVMLGSRVPYSEFISYPERYGMEKGKIEGLLAGIEAMLEVRFGPAGVALMPEVRKVEDPARLTEILAAAKTKPGPNDLRPLLIPSAANDTPAS